MAVRRESVVLELETNFPPEAARAAAAITLLNDRVKSVNKSSGEASKANREMAKSVDEVEKSSRSGGAEIDKYSGRLRVVADAAAVLGPSLIPIGAVGIPAVAGLASQMGFAALAGGTMIAAFQGVGDALKAVNKAAIDPTTANLDAARLAMEQISPAARGFVRELQSLEPQLSALQETAASGMFPGFTEGLDALQKRLPDVQRIVAAVAGELGDIGAAAGTSLASARWDDFFKFLADEAPHVLGDMATATGNVVHAMSELWMAFTPLNNGFGSWMVSATRDLDKWATGLSKTQGFAEFIDYVQTNGPQVAKTFGAIANMVLQIVEAAAPLGGTVLKGLEAVANVIASIADSDLGTPIFTALAALALYNRALQATAALSKSAFMGGGKAAQTTAAAASKSTTTTKGPRQQITSIRSDYKAAKTTQRSSSEASMLAGGAANVPLLKQGTVESDRLRGSLRSMGAEAGKAGALVGALAIASTDAGQSLGVTNTASLALAGTLAGPWGVAVGATVGATLDLAHANDDLESAISGAQRAMKSGDLTALAKNYDAAQKAQKKFGFDLTSTSSQWGKVFSLNPMRNMNVIWSGLNGNLSKYKRQLESIQGAMSAGGAAGAAEGLLKSQGLLANGMNLTAAGAKRQAAALAAARNAAATTGAAFTGLGKDVNDAKVSLGGWLNSLNEQNAALRGFANNSIRAAQRGLRDGLIKQLQAAGPEGALRLKQLANATDREIGRANRTFVRGKQAVDQYGDAVQRNMTGAAGRVNVFTGAIKSLPKRVQTEIRQNGLERTRAAVVDLTRKYRLTPRQVATLIREQGGAPTKRMVDNIIASARTLDRQSPNPRISAKDSASGTISYVRRALDALNGHTATTYVVTIHKGGSVMTGGGRTATTAADGDTVPKTGLPYADRHLYLLADGERVVSNRYGQVDRHKDLLDAINANRLADGGTTGLQSLQASIAAQSQPGAYYGRSGGSYGGSAGGSLQVQAGNTAVKVYIDGDELRSIAYEVASDVVDDDRNMTRMLERTAPAYG